MNDSVLSTFEPGAKYPEEWTAEEVVTFLSRPKRPPPVHRYFQSDIGRSTFIDNDITGAVLLDDSFTEDTLKNDLGITQVGVRIALCKIIKALRQKYPQQAAVDLADDLLLPPLPEQQNTDLISKAGRTEEGEDGYFGVQAQPETRVLKFGSLDLYGDDAILDPRVEWSRRFVSTPSKLITRSAHSIFSLNDGNDGNEDEEDDSNPQQIPTPCSPHLSNADDDAEGRATKRPRLDDGEEPEISTRMAPVQPTQTGEHAINNSMTLEVSEDDLQDAAAPQDDQPDYHIVTEDLPGMGDIPPIEGASDLLLPQNELEQPTMTDTEPTASSSLDPPRRSRVPRLRRLRQLRSNTYLDRSTLTASDMALVGNDSDDSDRFVICKKVSPGTSMGAARVMNAFLHKKSIDTAIINDKLYLAYRHHTIRHLHRFKRDPITIISDEKVQVAESLKSHIAKFPNLDVRKQTYRQKSDRIQLMNLNSTDGIDRMWMDPWLQTNGDGYYDALGEKYELLQIFRENDQFIPIHYGSRAHSPGLDPETRKELLHEQNSREKSRARRSTGTPLTPQEMEEIWDQVKLQAVKKWEQKKLPDLEKSKYKIWMQAKQRDVRMKLIINNKRMILELENRLSSHWDGYLKSRWYSVVELRRVMKSNSKASIQDREEASWWYRIIKGPRPERPDSLPTRRDVSRKTVELDEDAEGEEALMDDGSDIEEFDDVDSELSDFIVDDDAYDEGHEDLREENDAVLAQFRTRYEDDELAVGEILEDNEEEPKPKRKKDRQVVQPSDNHDEDIELPDAKPLVEDTITPLLEQTRKLTRASSNSFKWFSNELLEIAQNSETSVPEAPVNDDEQPKTPLHVEPIPIINKPETIAEPVATANDSALDFGDTGPFTIEEGTPACQPSTPQPIIKPEPGECSLLTAFSQGEVIDLTADETPVATPVKPVIPGPSTTATRGKKSAPIDLDDLPDEDTQIQQSIANSRITAHREGVILSPSPSPADQSLFEPTASSSAPRLPVRSKERPVIYKPTDKVVNPWKNNLQRQYDKNPQNPLVLMNLIIVEREAQGHQSFFNKVLELYDSLQRETKDSPQFSPTDEHAQTYLRLMNLYKDFSFPNPQGIDSKRKRKTLGDIRNFSRFMRELTPILNDIAEYEGGRMDIQPARNEILSKDSQAASQNSKRPINLESGDNTQIGDNDKGKGKNKGKGKPKQVSLLETDSEDDEPLSQRSFLEIGSEAEASRSGTNTPRRHKIHRAAKFDLETQRVRDQNFKERKKLKAREKRGIKTGQSGELVNLGHLAKDDPIYFPFDRDYPLYYFQKEGIQFLWKNLVVSEKRTGALLAHTMGMGKTRQVVTLLYAIADAATSDKPQTVSQIPQELRQMRALVVCPPGLIQNWSEEISKWADDSLAPIHLVTQALNMKERIGTIREWAVGGTVLIIGYESFNQLCRKNSLLEKELSKILNDSSISSLLSNEARIKDLKLELESTKDVQDLLLNTPTIVVADEAHKIKTKTSQIALLFHQFKTRTRIAMTGSPLANDLTEYYNIMKWVDPEYAGNEAEFNNNFKLPIRDGLYIDSLHEEVVESNKKQRELIALWQPKMHRVNIKQIEGIQDTLPPKTEFLITLPLTELQFKLYGFYAKEAKKDTEFGYYSGFFDFVTQLGVLLNHPVLFWKAFTKRQMKKAKAKASGLGESARITEVTSSDDDPAPESSEECDAEEDVKSQEAILGADSAVSDQLQEVITETKKLDDPIHSYRIQVLLKILESCIKIKEKVLVFSQSVETLKYIGDVLDEQKIKFVKITGNVSTAKRQSITKGFNDEDGNTFVFLISTKAGGLGLNIQAASRIVVFDSQFSPQDEEQAVGRAYRLGQKKHVFVYRFRIGGTYEDVIHNNSLLKMSLAARLVDKTNPARRAKKSEAADWFKPPRHIPRDPAGFETMRGKDPKVMDGFLEEDWVRELVTQDMYEIHYEELVPEGQDGEGVESTVQGQPKEPEAMDVDENTVPKLTATDTAPNATINTPPPETANVSTPTSNNLSLYGSKVIRTPKGREDLAAKVKRLKAKGGEKTPTPSSNLGKTTTPLGASTSNTKPTDTPADTPVGSSMAGPSTASKRTPAELKDEKERLKRGMRAAERKLEEKAQTAQGSVPSPLVLPSQRDGAESSQSPRTPTTPVSETTRPRQKVLGERSPRPYGSAQIISQPRGGQPSRTQRPPNHRKPYDRSENPNTHRRASAPQHRNQESYRSSTQASDSRRAKSPPTGTPQRRPDTERQKPPSRPPSPRDRR